MITRPAASATATPAGSLPVSETAAIAGSSIRRRTIAAGTRSAVKTPSGAPAARNTSAIASADPGTLDACFSTTGFPASSAGTAQRNNCQKGKFQGMTASTTPSGS